MGRTLTLVTIVAALAACSRKKAEGLPPAQDWSAERAEVIPPGVGPAQGGSPHDPHVAIGAGDPDDPHGGGAMAGGGGADPHAGVDMSAAHAGVDMAKMAPDPDRPIDPTHHIRGVIKPDAKSKGRLKAGTAVFVYAELPDANGNPITPPLAVEKLTWGKDDLAFELSEANAMVAGTELTGDVIVIAHYDQDGDAKSKQPGDVIGQIRVKIPAEAVSLVLDNVIP
jgi:hypothetical protein